MGIILHPDGEPNLAGWTDRPYEHAIGRWSGNGSCVAISRNCVITTRHQYGGTSSKVVIDGTTYNVQQIWNHSDADLRLVKLEKANLRHYVSLYTDNNEIDQEIIIGGYGKGRGAILQTSGTTYGYEWAGSGNITLRWCTNKINETEDDDTLGSWTSDIIIADFDGLNEGDSTDYEGTIAEFDSGGGWFIKVGGTWKVAGLSRTVIAHYEPGHEGDPDYTLDESWFRNREHPQVLNPDGLDAVRVSSYQDWINNTLPEILAGDLNGDDHVDFTDFAVFARYYLNTDCQEPDWCLGTDSEPDGDVDLDDLNFMLSEWLNSL